jgi:hypothetical protein
MDIRTIALLVAAGLLLHHIWIHPEYSFPDRMFQISDVSNHETWVVAALAVAFTAPSPAQ